MRGKQVAQIDTLTTNGTVQTDIEGNLAVLLVCVLAAEKIEGAKSQRQNHRAR